MTTQQIASQGSQTVNALISMLSDVPNSPDEIRSRREAVLAAAAAFEPLRSPVAAALASCVTTLRSRAAEVRRASSAPPVPPAEPQPPTEAAPVESPMATAAWAFPPPQPAPENEFHEKRTIAMPATYATEPVVEEAPAPSKGRHWGVTERMLYEDVLNLFELGDQAGAMTSLERLIMLEPSAEELGAFLDKNGALLVKLYGDHLGSMDRVPVPLRDSRPVKIPTASAPLVMDVLRLADGHRTIREILKKSRLGDVQTLASIAHLARSGFLELA